MSTKLIVGCISGTGALGGVVAGSYYLLNKETEKSQELTNQEESRVTKNTKPLKELIGDGFESLDIDGETDTENWKKLIAKYNEEGNTPKIDVNGITKEPTKDDNAENIKKLKNACKTLLTKTNNIEDNDKTIAKNWCNKLSTLIEGK